ncbi:GCN5 family acetyltransferase [Aestuariimicrobium kwangyangense]|uniref:GCN5 family acetyltransferase n=1 Tax=Aestuariimicrobium kwangyangense TaxID=396389 RepID=UPI0012F8633C|nr:GCN5 family acetyltransferase [Aestuariimicrobium kwangyangense]
MTEHVPAPHREEFGIVTAQIHGGVVISLRNDPAFGWCSRALGFGITEPITPAVLDDIVTVFRDNRTAVALVQVAPPAEPRPWGEMFQSAGLTPGATWIKLLRGMEPLPPRADGCPVTDLEIREIKPAERERAYEVGCQTLEMPPDMKKMWAGMGQGENFHFLGGFDGGRLVSIGVLHLKDGRAGFCGAGTLPSHRGRGAQAAMFAHRIELARQAGARVCVAETGAEGKGEHNSSLANMRRAGFRDAYPRRNLIWRNPDLPQADA